MQGLEGARPTVEEWCAGAGVGKGVDAGEEEVECEAPVGEDCEVGEGLAGCDAAAIAGGDAAPDEVEY